MWNLWSCVPGFRRSLNKCRARRYLYSHTTGYKCAAATANDLPDGQAPEHGVPPMHVVLLQQFKLARIHGQACQLLLTPCQRQVWFWLRVVKNRFHRTISCFSSTKWGAATNESCQVLPRMESQTHESMRFKDFRWFKRASVRKESIDHLVNKINNKIYNYCRFKNIQLHLYQLLHPFVGC